ncbi:hypothetical protein MMC34_004368 [Xylographa carneopallida]|nr:hypothetical protein [Xylographa carneopallida]
MVTRKPVASGSSDPLDHAPQPFHSTSSSLADNQYQYEYGDLLGTGLGGEWENVETEKESHNVTRLPSGPGTTVNRIGGQELQTEGILPVSLQIRRQEATPASSFGTQSSEELFPRSHDLHEGGISEHSLDPPQSKNPFYRVRSADRVSQNVLQSQEESSVDIWADMANPPPPPSSAPPPPPIDHELQGLSQMSMEDHHPYHDNEASGPWSYDDTSKHGQSAWISSENTEQYHVEDAQKPSSFAENSTDYRKNQTGWHDDNETASSGLHKFNTVAHEPFVQPQDQTSRQSADLSSAFGGVPELPSRPENAFAPQLPPRRASEMALAPRQPPRPVVQGLSDDAAGNSRLQQDKATMQSKATKQRSETYQIKHIRWADSYGNTRTSPIMVQNANGPCPLLALVNALTLSTPRDLDTALIETLRVREQVSLGLLLDAVFDELMSGRRGDAAQGLPDVGELYSFLITLHTGMNVNPRFIPLGDNISVLIDIPGSDASSSTSGRRPPGGFEETKEMKLYSTFSIPLIHGWLPLHTSPVYVALQRSAGTYEDAQNLMFREEELEDKLQREGLKQDEQILLEDIASIKYFLSSSATQLTEYGLHAISDTLLPGSIAILFRNDHFSTLYQHPRTGQLLTLVTDMGYAGHEEVVWESLVDVSGEGSEFFAGDFRPVGNSTSETYTNSQNAGPSNGQPWTTVSHHNPSSRPQNTQKTSGLQTALVTTSNPQRLPTPPNDQDYTLPTSPTTEQEDHDLALALQLQEEEEDRSRRESAARRREDELSQAYLESQLPPTQRPNAQRGQSQTIRPMVPPRGGSNVVNTTRRPNPRADPEAGEDAPPPSYEQAAKSQPYLPPVGEPPYSPPTPINRTVSGAGLRSPPQGSQARQMSAYSQHASSVGNLPSTQRRSVVGRPPSGIPARGGLGGSDGGPAIARRRSAGPNNPSWDDDADKRDKDCNVM